MVAKWLLRQDGAGHIQWKIQALLDTPGFGATFGVGVEDLASL
jgi:hypothetical protein